MVEANIDFVDEHDVPDDLVPAELPDLIRIRKEMQSWTENGNRGEILRSGYRVVIAGLPNAGKSSLLNAFSGRDAAIVTDVAGTTRDVIEVCMDLDGFPIVLTDTAGLRESRDPVERIGVESARGRIKEAELIVWVADERGQWPGEAKISFESDALWVRSKADIGADFPVLDPDGNLPVPVSVVTGDGVDVILGEIGRLARERLEGAESYGLARARQLEALNGCLRGIDDTLAGFENGAMDLELVGEALRGCVQALGVISGRVDVEDILDVVFGEFCIGK